MKDYQVGLKIKKETRFERVYHLDCYRIDAAGLLDLGWQDIIEDKKNLILLEWPENVEKALSEKYLQINFEVLGENKRRIRVS